MIEISPGAPCAPTHRPPLRLLLSSLQRPDPVGLRFSRDDAGSSLEAYYEKKIYESDPFARLDQHVWPLIAKRLPLGPLHNPVSTWALRRARGDPSSVMFFHDIGLDYVSCSPSGCPLP